MLPYPGLSVGGYVAELSYGNYHEYMREQHQLCARRMKSGGQGLSRALVAKMPRGKEEWSVIRMQMYEDILFFFQQILF